MFKKILLIVGIALLLIGITGYFYESALIVFAGMILVIIAWAIAVSSVPQENPGI